MNGKLPSPGEYAFCMSLAPIVAAKYKTVIRDFMKNEEEVYKLTFRLFPLFKTTGITKEPLLTKLFCGSLYQNGIISGEEQPINDLGPYPFNEYWDMAFQPSFWPADHTFKMDHLLTYADVLDQWQQKKKDLIDTFEAQLGLFRGKLEA